MAKGGNSARSKKSHSSKPYDVSNSFVRKVASRVTSFIPQPSWLSKWFVSSNEDKANSDDQDSDTETVSEYRSSKRPKIDLQRPFPVNSFRVAPPSESEDVVDLTTGRIENVSRFSSQRAPDDPIPGPSGLNKQQVKVNTAAPANLANDGIATTLDHRNIRPRPSLSTYLNQSTVSSGSVDRKINGDDGSESSESTSGCSSLPHRVTHQTSINNSASNIKRNFDNATPTNRRLLLLNRTRSPRVNTSLNRRRSLFNVSAFGSPSLESDTSLSRSAVINSPFYAGRTGYGGASAYRRSHDFTPEINISRRSSVEVQPVNSGSSSKTSDMAAMSQTTRRILEALEQFASPVQDAKKMMIDSPSMPALASKRSRIDPPLTEQKSSLRQLTIPTVPDLIKLRRREKLQDSLESARLIANATKDNSYNSTKDNSYQLRCEDNSRSGKVLGRKTNIEEEETVKEVNLPSISLPITVLPKFDIEVPPQLSPPCSSSVGALKFASPIMIQDFSRTASSKKVFTFSEPLRVSENHLDGKSLNTNKNLHAVMDIPVTPKMDTCVSGSSVKENSVFSSLTSVTGGSRQASLFSSDLKMKSAPAQTTEAEGKKPDRNVPETSPKNGEVLHTFGTPSGTVRNVTSDAAWGSIMKASSDTWECGTCLIRNKLSASRCIACTEPRQLPQASSSFSHSTEQLRSSSSKELNKSSKLETAEVKTLAHDEGKKASNDVNKAVKVTWECATCWIRNPETLSKCQACETSKPKEKTETSTVIGKKPADTWECPTCMIRNKNEAQKCAACEEPKPGSAATAVAKSTLKFNVDIPAEASKFTFGIDKSQATALSSTTPKGFSFGKTEGTTTASGFSFGKTEGTTATSGFSFGKTEGTTATSGFSFGKTESATTASGFKFGMGDNGKSNSENTNSDKKPMFTFGVPHSVEVKANTSAKDEASGDHACSSDDSVAKLRSSQENETLSEKQENVVKTAQKSNLPCADPQNKENSSNVSSVGYLSGGSNKQTSETPVVNFKFLTPSSSSESISSISSTNLFSFGTKTVTNAPVKPSSEENAVTKATNEASESEKKSVKSSQSESVREVTPKSEKDTLVFGATQVSTTVSSVPVSDTKTVLTDKEHLTKLAAGSQTNSVPCLPISIPNKNDVSASSVSILPKPVDIITSAASVPVSVPQSSSSGTSLSFGATNTVPQMFGTSVAAAAVSVAPVNFSAPLTTVQNFGNVTSVQHSGAVTTSATSSVGSSTASTSSFTSIPATTTPQFGSSAALNFTAPTTTTTNFSTDKPVLNFGATSASESNSGTSVFANAPAVSASGTNTLFGNQKSLTDQRFGTPVSTTSTFSSNSAQNFGASATNLSGFGAPSTSSQQFGVPTTTPAFSLTTPAFGATGTQNFGSVTTPGASFSSPVSGTFTSKPAVDNSSKGSAPLGFSSNTSLPSLPFAFGSTQNSASDAPGAAGKPSNFSFGASNTSSAGQSSGFGFGNFGSSSAAPASGGPTIFGPGTAPAFGTSGNAGFTGPAFFGQNLQANNNVFGFTSSQGANGAQTSQNAASTFSFSSTQPSGPPTFNPNVKPSFNFTGGNTPTFTAEANSPAPPAQRRIKKAVRRTQTRANAL